MTPLPHGPRFERQLCILTALAGLCLASSGCGSDADLSRQMLGNTREGMLPDPSENGGEIDRSSWWCLEKTPPGIASPSLLNRPVVFVLPVVDWANRQPLAGRGLTATLCPGTLFRCSQPLIAPYVVPAPRTLVAEVEIPVPEGFDGFIQLAVSDGSGSAAADSYLPVDYYLGAPISRDRSIGQPVAMLTHRYWQAALEQSFSGTDPTVALAAGAVLVGVFDCAGAPVTGARIEISLGGGSPDGITSFVLPSSRIPLAQPAGEPLLTGSSGVVGYLGVPPGAVQLRAYRGEDAQPFASTELGTVAGELSVAALRPAYLSDASLEGAIEF